MVPNIEKWGLNQSIRKFQMWDEMQQRVSYLDFIPVSNATWEISFIKLNYMKTVKLQVQLIYMVNSVILVV